MQRSSVYGNGQLVQAALVDVGHLDLDEGGQQVGPQRAYLNMIVPQQHAHHAVEMQLHLVHEGALRHVLHVARPAKSEKP